MKVGHIVSKGKQEVPYICSHNIWLSL